VRLPYAARRLLQTPFVLLGVSLVVFGTLALVPGDPALAILGPHATPERVAALRVEMGLDRPLPLRYAHWLADAARGDLGYAYSVERPVAHEVMERLGATALLATAAFALLALAGLAAGTAAALRHDRATDRIVSLLVTLGLATPPFWLAMLLVLVFAADLRLFPVSGMTWVYGDGGVLDVAHHLVLPAVALAVVGAAIVARFFRTSLLETLSQEYVRTARAKGLPERRVLVAHAARNALVPVLPVLGLQAGYVLGGALYVETVFQWPGLGRMLVEAVQARDLVLVQGGVLVLATAYVLVNLAADLLQGALDPRIRSG